MAMSYRAKKHGLYACIASILVLSQAIEAASYETGSWKERLYAGLYSWWNKPRTPYPDWAKYAFVGGLGIAAIAATYTLWLQRSQKSKPYRARRVLDATEEKLHALDPIMARVYGYLNDMQNQKLHNYQAMLTDLREYEIISNNIEKPLDVACTLVWYPNKKWLNDFFRQYNKKPDLVKLFDHMQLNNYLTAPEINAIRDISEQQQAKFFKDFRDKFLQPWNALRNASSCINAQMKLVEPNRDARNAFLELIAILPKAKIRENLVTIKTDSSEKYIQAVLNILDKR